MPFEDLETFHKANAQPRATMSYKPAWSKRGGADKTPKLTIAIPTTICGTSKAELFRVQIGKGDDAGKLRISPAKKGDKAGVKPSEHAHFFRFNFGFVPHFGKVNIPEDKYPVAKVADDTFEITIPKSWSEPEPDDD